jgi:predicted Rossmann fold flavoprotein
MKIAVVGAGASGLLAALHAAWQGAPVTLFEQNPSLGRKLLVTGSGRCNLTNEHVAAHQYTCADPNWLGTLLDQFGLSELLNTLKKLGIPTYKTWDGWYYPLSNSAHSVVDAIGHAVKLAGIKTQLSSQVIDITRSKDGYKLLYRQGSSQDTDYFDRVIVSSGGKAYPTLGSTGALFPVLGQLGHTVLPIQPALAPVLADLQGLKTLQGVRLDLGASLFNERTMLASTAGNVIFTKWGLNGPAVMDLSHHIPDPPGDRIHLSLNLLHFIEDEFNRLLHQKQHTQFPVALLLSAFFPPKVVECYLTLAGIVANISLSALDQQTLQGLINQLKDTRLKVQGVRGYQYCQASAGGVPTGEVSQTRLESHLLPGLYLTGETLDVVGPCGGYNLHFAFASGSLAGQAAGS